jgi:hypothetical protein
MGAYGALVAKCAPDDFRESLARFRADRPPTSLASVGRILTRFFAMPAALSQSLGKLGNQFDHFGLGPRAHSARAHIAIGTAHQCKLGDVVAVCRLHDHQEVRFT